MFVELMRFLFLLSFGIECKLIPDSTLDLNEVAYHNELSEIYLGSSSIIRLSSGRLVASHDFFGSGCGSNPANVSVYVSDDNGQSWLFLSYIKHSYWTTLTVYNNIIYAIGVDNDANGSVIIHRSSDNGATWMYNGNDDGIEEDDPLMNSNNWRITPPVAFAKNWIPKSYPILIEPEFLEGNVVILPKLSSSGEIRVLTVLRFNSLPLSNLTIILELNQTTNNLSFASIIKFPGGMTKFTIRYDPVTKTYFSFVNPVLSPLDPYQRNILSLSYTKDLVNLSEWNIVADRLLYDDTGLTSIDSLRYTGFHYVDWQFDQLSLSSSSNQSSCIEWNCDGGPHIIYLIRTSYRGANSFHNSNRITYKTLENYRELIKQHLHELNMKLIIA